MAPHFEGLHDLQQLGSEGEGNVHGVGRGHDVFDVFEIDGDLSARDKIAGQHHGRFDIQHGGTGQPAPNGLIDLFWVCPGLSGQDQGLGDGGDGQVDNDLVG